MRPIRALLALLYVGTTAVVAAEPPSAGALPQDAFTPHLAGALREPSLILVSRELSRLRHYRGGALISEYEVGFGQADGAKQLRGDLKTPRGSYRFIVKSQGRSAATSRTTTAGTGSR